MISKYTWLQEGHVVHAQLKIGDMSCIEYSAMMGYHEVLRLLIDMSINAATLKQYFALNGRLLGSCHGSFSVAVGDAYLVAHFKTAPKTHRLHKVFSMGVHIPTIISFLAFF